MARTVFNQAKAWRLAQTWGICGIGIAWSQYTGFNKNFFLVLWIVVAAVGFGKLFPWETVADSKKRS